MTEPVKAAPRREDARDLQTRLYRDIGISAVAAALRFTTQPEPAARRPGVETASDRPHLSRTRAA